MAADLLIYADGQRQLQTAGSLIVFGAQNVKRAKIIQEIHLLEEYNSLLQANKLYDRIALVEKFIFDYLIDCVRILIFFEGYMKAELIIGNFCVHNLCKGGKYAHLGNLANQQKKRPINLEEIKLVEPFIIDQKQEIITHEGIKDTTLGMNVLLGPKYRIHYQFDDDLLEDIKYFNALRNKLHFNASAEFQLSTQFIDRIKRVNNFVDVTLKKWIKEK